MDAHHVSNATRGIPRTRQDRPVRIGFFYEVNLASAQLKYIVDFTRSYDGSQKFHKEIVVQIVSEIEKGLA